MRKKRSLGINAVLSGIKTILSVIFPLITFPYISRVLTVENVGRYNFATSVMTYVSLFAALGVNTYAIRECSKVRDNRQELDKTASEIFSINVISTIIAYALLFVLLIFVPFFKPYRLLIAVLSINVAFTTMGCEWIYTAHEEYLYITIRSLFTHIISLALLFVLVRHSEDVVQYAIVTVIATSGGNLLYLFGRKRYSSIRVMLTADMKKHIPPVLTMFANTVTTSIYVNSDIIILEILATDTIVGLYSASTKIYTIIKNVMAAVITVSIPRLSHQWEVGKINEYNDTCYKVFLSLLTIVAPAMIGLFSLSKYIILLISSSKYIEATISLQILSIALLFSIFAWFYKSCVLIPTKNESKILKATIAASLVNIVLNFILIPFWGQNAAALTTLIAEVICLAVTFSYGKEFCRPHINGRDWISVLVGCAVIYGICMFSSRYFSRTYIIVLAAMIGSVFVYGLILFLFGNSMAVFAADYIKHKASKKE